MILPCLPFVKEKIAIESRDGTDGVAVPMPPLPMQETMLRNDHALSSDALGTMAAEEGTRHS